MKIECLPKGLHANAHNTNTHKQRQVLWQVGGNRRTQVVAFGDKYWRGKTVDSLIAQLPTWAGYPINEEH